MFLIILKIQIITYNITTRHKRLFIDLKTKILIMRNDRLISYNFN